MKYIYALALIVISGCSMKPAVFTPYYIDAKPIYNSSYDIKSPILIAVQDQRPYVISGKKTAYFAGLFRGQLGIPSTLNSSNTTTELLLDYMKLLLITKDSYNIMLHPISITANGKNEALKAGRGKRTLLIQVKEWKSDTIIFGSGRMWYNLEATVFDHKGNLVFTKKVKGSHEVTNPDPVKKPNGKVTGRWYQKAHIDALGKIMLAPQVIKALTVK